MLTQQILYSAEEVQQLVAKAHQAGVTAGYTLAVQEEVFELAAKKQEEERQKHINWQGLCESGQGGETWSS
ncbi:MAG: hypothetical protein A2Y72_03560 [Chloroflexi bacterium RBG_13_53_26]|nr:MAG: hypothetical protein A2Y72_03560 [Chloroflexi bacterium RBG_13_53_26]